MGKILTVVVPTYNAEQYLRDNLESFCIPELLPDIEILIINDGSTDHSVDVAMEYVNRYPDSYRVVNKENGGHGSGINSGIEHAAGTYFKVVDADDWVDQKAFKGLVETLRKSECDIVYSGFYWTYDEGQKDKETFRKKAETEVPFPGVQYQKTYEFDAIADQIYVKMHNVTIRTEILRAHAIHIDEHCFYVDTEYITYPIPYVKTICFVDAFVYMYRIGRQGQSVGIDKMQRNEKNYDKVITSLLTFYSSLGGELACTEAKRKYIAGIIARVVAGKIKIMLSFPAAEQKKQELRVFDENLKTQYPDIYKANINAALKLLRTTNYILYRPASLIVKMKYH